jgi:hypothetical protein
MDTVKAAVSGMFILIVLFLLLSNKGASSADIINSIGHGAQELTTALQGGA